MTNYRDVDFSIAAADIALLQEELDITKELAESILKAQRGNVTEALRQFIRGD
jgi:hypothetical protein